MSKTNADKRGRNRDGRMRDCRAAVDAYVDARPCERCGWDGPRAGKELHHRQPLAKIDSPKVLCSRNQIDRAMIELEKCMVVCGTCHNLIHAEIREGRLSGRH